MEGIKEAIAYITGLAVKAEDPKTVEINGKTYCTKDLVRYDAPEKAAPISATTLTSLVDYIKENREELRDRMIIQVVNETKVLLYSGLLAERDRETLFEVNALLPRFEYGREYDQESFLISMQSCFKESDDREAVTMLASNIVNTQEATFSDNGTTQQAVMKTGITTKDNVLVPNPVNLIPYRTFLEVEQPAIEAGIITPSTKTRLMELEADRADIEKGIAHELLAEPEFERDQIIYFLERFRSGDINDEAYRIMLVDTFLNSVYLYDDDHLVLVMNYSGENCKVDLKLVEGAVSGDGCKGSAFAPSSA